MYGSISVGKYGAWFGDSRGLWETLLKVLFDWGIHWLGIHDAGKLDSYINHSTQGYHFAYITKSNI
jgi:hypothetical protein